MVTTPSMTRRCAAWSCGRSGKKYEGGGYKDAAPEELEGDAPAGRWPGRASTPVAGHHPGGAPEQGARGLRAQPAAAGGPGRGAAPSAWASCWRTRWRRWPSATRTRASCSSTARWWTPQGKPYTLPNVRTVVFREEEGSFLVGALAGLATKTGKVGFVGGMEVPLIKQFEAGFRAGVAATNPKATVVANYTGSFDNVAAGKQVGQDLLTKGADVVFHAAGVGRAGRHPGGEGGARRGQARLRHRRGLGPVAPGARGGAVLDGQARGPGGVRGREGPGAGQASREATCRWACGRAASPTPRCGWTSPARTRPWRGSRS